LQEAQDLRGDGDAGAAFGVELGSKSGSLDQGYVMSVKELISDNSSKWGPTNLDVCWRW